MRQGHRIFQNQIILEQTALLFTSFVWTTVILSALVLIWAIQDMESNWNLVLGIQPTLVAPEPELALVVPPTPTSSPTFTPVPTETPTETPTPTPSATPTQVAQPPSILPDTPNEDDATPIPVIIHADETTSTPTVTPTSPPTATVTPTPKTAATAAPPTPKPSPTPSPIPAEPPTRLIIQSVGIDSEVKPVGWNVVEQNGQQYSVWQVADYAVGWHETTAFPGQPGNTVMAGHHNIKGEVFRDLVNVEVGDEVVVYTKNKKFTYKVEQKTIVKEKGEPLEVRQKNAEWIAATTDERLTMVTCWPYTNNTHRVIVVAKPVNSE